MKILQLECTKYKEAYRKTYESFQWFEAQFYDSFDEVGRWQKNYIEEAVKLQFPDQQVKGIEYWILCDIYNKAKQYDGVREILGPVLLKSDFVYKEAFDHQFIFGFKMRK
jgi:hypothetical protein